MEWNFDFFLTAAGLGVALAMDAFSVSMANGLNEPGMKKKKMCTIALTFALFQIVMPLIGWACFTFLTNIFDVLKGLVPLIALILLLIIGGKMLIDGIKNKEEETEAAAVGFKALIVQGIATSIDALSVGTTIAGADYVHALVVALIIGVLTFGICIGGVVIGKKLGTKLSNKATILGGVILIIIGIKIFIEGFGEFTGFLSQIFAK